MEDRLTSFTSVMEKILICKRNVARVQRTLITTLIINLCILANGFGSAYPSPVAIQLQMKGLLNMHTIPIFASIYQYTSVLGPAINYPLMNLFGRKTLILLSTIPFVLGWILIIIGTSAIWLIIGRALSGIGDGMLFALVPIYIGEISEAKSRGYFLAATGFFLFTGVSACYGAGILLPYTWLAAIPISINLIMLICLICLPYSPVWLAERGYQHSALTTLEHLRGKTYNIDEEYIMIVDALDTSNSVTVRERMAYFRKPHAIKVILVSIGITILFHLSGEPLITAYASLFLKNINILTPNIVVFLLSLPELLGNCSYSVMTDKVGRKFLLCVSLAIIILGHICLSIYNYIITYAYPQCGGIGTSNNTDYQTISCNTSINYICSYLSIIPIVGILIINTSFSVGIGSISLTYIGELFPIRVKALGANLTILINRLFGAIIILLFPFFAFYASTYVAFLTLAIMLFISIPMVILFVPETKRKSIVEIEELFKNKCLHIC